MKKFILKGVVITASLAMAGMAATAQAAESVNIAFLLEWATPNQTAKVDKTYDEAMGVDINWTNFLTGVQMTKAMLPGDIDIAYSQRLAPFVTAIQQGAQLNMVGIAVVYEANNCFVHNNHGITSANASELEGKTIAVPLNTMADFSFRKQMVALDVDVSTMTIVAAEMLAGTRGIGFIENVARTVSDYKLIWVTILIMGLLFDIVMRWVFSRLIPWRGKR